MRARGRRIREPARSELVTVSERPSFEILIDGECPLCRREAAAMRWLDRRHGRLVITDITDAQFDPTGYGVTFADLMGTIHGVRADGRLVTGMEAFRRAYAAVGLGWVLAPTGWPGLRGLFDVLYRVFARHRLRLTGRRCETACAPSERVESARGTAR